MHSDQVPDHLIRSTEMCRLTGCSYRQLDWWARVGDLVPVVQAAGSGSSRGYAPEQVVKARVLAMLSVLVSDKERTRGARSLRSMVRSSPTGLGSWDGRAFGLRVKVTIEQDAEAAVA